MALFNNAVIRQKLDQDMKDRGGFNRYSGGLIDETRALNQIDIGDASRLGLETAQRRQELQQLKDAYSIDRGFGEFFQPETTNYGQYDTKTGLLAGLANAAIGIGKAFQGNAAAQTADDQYLRGIAIDRENTAAAQEQAQRLLMEQRQYDMGKPLQPNDVAPYHAATPESQEVFNIEKADLMQNGISEPHAHRLSLSKLVPKENLQQENLYTALKMSNEFTDNIRAAQAIEDPEARQDAINSISSDIPAEVVKTLSGGESTRSQAIRDYGDARKGMQKEVDEGFNPSSFDSASIIKEIQGNANALTIFTNLLKGIPDKHKGAARRYLGHLEKAANSIKRASASDEVLGTVGVANNPENTLGYITGGTNHNDMIANMDGSIRNANLGSGNAAPWNQLYLDKELAPPRSKSKEEELAELRARKAAREEELAELRARKAARTGGQ